MAKRKKQKQQSTEQKFAGETIESGSTNASGGESKEKASLNKASWMYLLVLVLFLASGLSALVYQVVWTRLLVLVFGATTFATATVLASFMGGLASGSWLAGRIADRLERPFLWYGILEAIIGAWGLLVPFLVQWALPLYKLIWQQAHLSVLSFGVMQLLIVGAILLVPTTCMGATLPLLSRFVTNKIENAGEKIGTLYAINTCGAICGAALAGYYFLPNFGLSASTVIAAMINFGLCAVVVFTSPPATKAASAPTDGFASADMKGDEGAGTGVADSHKTPQEPSLTAPPNTQAATFSKQKLPLPIIATLTAFAVSGAVALIYEVAWTRNLLFVVGGSTYAFTIMVTTFLAGIFLGALICARFIDRIARPMLVFAGLEFLLGILTVVTMQFFNYVPFYILKTIADANADEAAVMGAKILLSSLTLVPLTLCLGAIFPAVVRICARDQATVGRSVGTAYAANTLGAIVGSIASGFILLPLVGAEQTLIICAGVNVVLALLLVVVDDRLAINQKIAAAMVAAMAVAGLALRPKIFDSATLLHAQTESRSFKQGMTFPYTDYDDWKKRVNDIYDVPFYKDGTTSNVAVLRMKASKTHSIVTSGEIDGSDTGDMALQLLLTGYPLLIKPDSKDVAMIGWGTGVSAGVATLFPIEKLTGIEIEPAVIEATKFFHPVNHEPEKNVKVDIQYNDGRNYLLACDQMYDMIISEPSNPWRSGVCNLFTSEYFGICKSRLRPGGMFALWLQISEVPPELMQSVLSALRLHFPHAVVFMPNVSNVIVLASDQQILIKPHEIDKLLEDTHIGTDMAKAKLRTSERMISQMQIADDGYQEMTKGVAPNTDDKNQLEYIVAKHYQTKLFYKENVQLMIKYAGSPWDNIDWKGFSKEEKLAYMRKVAEANRTAMDLRNIPLAERWEAQAKKEAGK